MILGREPFAHSTSLSDPLKSTEETRSTNTLTFEPWIETFFAVLARTFTSDPVTVIWSTFSLTWTVPPELATTAFPPTTVAAVAFLSAAASLQSSSSTVVPPCADEPPFEEAPAVEPPFESFELLDPLSEAMFCSESFPSALLETPPVAVTL